MTAPSGRRVRTRRALSRACPRQQGTAARLGQPPPAAALRGARLLLLRQPRCPLGPLHRPAPSAPRWSRPRRPPYAPWRT
eukprot:5354145-Pleurochrysis_carterae.AAC.2